MSFSKQTPDVPHQWLMDRLTAATMQGWIPKDVAELVYDVFVQRFPDEVAEMKREINMYRAHFHVPPILDPEDPYDHPMGIFRDLEQQGDSYITESANEQP